MARLHLFYPENDLALALNDVNYTAPRAAVDLRISGEPIAMWLGNDGDKFVTQGVNAKWYDAIVEAFDVRVDLFDGDTTSLQPQPWGWSLPVRKMFLDLGFDECVLPPVEQIERIRLLSHRRTSMGLAQQLFGDFGAVMGSPAVEVDRAEDILDYVHSHGRAMIKLPWSSSGRGVVDTFNLSDDEIVRRAMGTVRKQGTVMLEPFYDNPRNFAYLYEMRNGEARFSGYSLFDVDSHCAYSGSVVANDAILESKIAEFVDVELLRAVRDELQTQLTNVVGDAYDGYLGVDMMAANGILAVAEMNLRTTMGHVAHRLAERFVADGAVGRFAIVPRTDNSIFMPTDCTIQNNGLTAGTLDLVPADRRNRFLLKIG
jgi:hypothetical protein